MPDAQELIDNAALPEEEETIEDPLEIPEEEPEAEEEPTPEPVDAMAALAKSARGMRKAFWWMFPSGAVVFIGGLMTFPNAPLIGSTLGIAGGYLMGGAIVAKLIAREVENILGLNNNDNHAPSSGSVAAEKSQ